MSDFLSRAAIPTNSFFLISRMAGAKIGDNVQFIRATASTGTPGEKTKLSRFLTVYRTSRVQASLTFNRATARKPFSFSETDESIAEAGLHDLWIHELHLRIDYERKGVFDFVFKNDPLTDGSEAQRFVLNYLKRLVLSGQTSLVQVRHLPLVSALSYPRGAHLDQVDLGDPTFIRWLSSETGGLVKMKTVQRVDESMFMDVSFKEAS